MKYIIIIPDGAADHPLDTLDGRTPLEAANIPNMDRLALQGRQGTCATTPKGMPCGSDVCSLCLFGYDPLVYHKGRAPLEAASLGIDLAPTDWVFRVNLVTVIDGLMQDHSAGHISSDESRQLLAEFSSQLDLADTTLYPGVSYRNIMVDRSLTNNPNTGRDWAELATTPPHDIPGLPIAKHMPVGGDHAEALSRFILQSEKFLANHEINRTRIELGESPATHFWPWGQGLRPVLDSFEKRFGLRGAMITAVDLLAGIASFIEWDRLDVPGQTSYHDTDYAAAGHYAIKAVNDYDIVCVHVEAPDEAGHASDAATKVAAIESIDQFVVGPILDAMQSQSEPYRILCMPDHYTAVATRKHDPTPVPFVIAGDRVGGVLKKTFSEANAEAADLHIEFGHELMEYFLFSGLQAT